MFCYYYNTNNNIQQGNKIFTRKNIKTKLKGFLCKKDPFFFYKVIKNGKILNVR